MAMHWHPLVRAARKEQPLAGVLVLLENSHEDEVPKPVEGACVPAAPAAWASAVVSARAPAQELVLEAPAVESLGWKKMELRLCIGLHDVWNH